MTASNTLRSYFPDYLNKDSLFQKMQVLGAPWSIEMAQDMDEAYFKMYSGIKNPSDFVHQNLYDDIANSLTIARILWGIYGKNWTRLWESYNVQYVPIENYNMQETSNRTRTDDRTIDRTDDFTSTVDGTEKIISSQDGTTGTIGSSITNVTSDDNSTSSLQHGENISRSAEANEFTFAFNSEEKVPTHNQIETGTEGHTGTDTTTTTSHSLSDSDTNSKTDVTENINGTSDSTTTNARTDKSTGQTLDNVDTKEDAQLTRKGNIGVTSSQQLLKQEFELWKWNFFFQVFDDVDKFLTLSVYSCGGI